MSWQSESRLQKMAREDEYHLFFTKKTGVLEGELSLFLVTTWSIRTLNLYYSIWFFSDPEKSEGFPTASKIVAPLVVIGSLITGLLMALLLYRRRSQREYPHKPSSGFWSIWTNKHWVLTQKSCKKDEQVLQVWCSTSCFLEKNKTSSPSPLLNYTYAAITW